MREAAGAGAAARVNHVHLPGQFGAAVFDLDGLLIDSEPIWVAAERRLLESYGLAITDQDRLDTLGRASDVAAAIYGARIGLPKSQFPRLHAELLSLASRAYADARLCPGAADLLDSLNGRLPIGLASSTPRELVHAAIAAKKLAGRFAVVVAREDVARPKPAPDPYVVAAMRLGVPASNVIVFEDSDSGAQSAVDAGCAVALVRSTSGATVQGVRHVLRSLRDVSVEQ